jgi:hypothetical protein
MTGRASLAQLYYKWRYREWSYKQGKQDQPPAVSERYRLSNKLPARSISSL